MAMVLVSEAPWSRITLNVLYVLVMAWGVLPSTLVSCQGLRGVVDLLVKAGESLFVYK